MATIVLKTVIALGLALLLTSGIKRLTYFHRVVMYLPAVLPMLVVSLVFKSILNPATGLLNTFLRSVGLDFLAQRWLVDVHLGAALGDRRRYLARGRLHHGDPDRRSAGDPKRILRSRRHRWRQRLGMLSGASPSRC